VTVADRAPQALTFLSLVEAYFSLIVRNTADPAATAAIDPILHGMFDAVIAAEVKAGDDPAEASRLVTQVVADAIVRLTTEAGFGSLELLRQVVDAHIEHHQTRP